MDQKNEAIKSPEQIIPQFHFNPESEEESRIRVEAYEQEQEKIRNSAKIQAYHESGVPKRYWNESFETWKPRNVDDDKRLAKIMEYANREKNDCVLLLLGPKGLGKTHLGTSIIREVGGTFTSSEEMIFKFEAAMDYSSDISRLSLMNFYSSTKMLVIDEIGRSNQQQKESYCLNLILRKRYENLLPTVLISNLKKEDLMKSLGEAVVDRLIETCEAVEFVGESYRIEKRKIA